MKPKARRRQEPAVKPHPLDELSFVAPISANKHPKGYRRSLWSVARSSDYHADTAIGRSYAEELIAWLRHHPEDRCDVLRNICADMVRDGRCDGVAVGFLGEIERFFLAGVGLQLPRRQVAPHRCEGAKP